MADYDPSQPVTDLKERTYHLRGITKCDYDLVINPDLQSHIKRQWVEIDFVKYWQSPSSASQESFIPERPSCYTNFGSLGSSASGFQTSIYESNILSGSYNEGKAIIDFDWTKQRFTLQSSYQAQIGYDANVVFIPNATVYGTAKVCYENLLMRLSLYTVTEFEGKEETTISTRTFLPKYEWDPDMYNKYKNLYPRMSSLNNLEPGNGNSRIRPAALYIDEQHPEGVPMENYK